LIINVFPIQSIIKKMSEGAFIWPINLLFSGNSVHNSDCSFDWCLVLFFKFT
jgi:hypothetical protein